MGLRSWMALVLFAATAPLARASDELEIILLDKFSVQNKAALARIRADLNDAIAKAQELKDFDPDAGIDLLRAIRNRIDIARVSPADRRGLAEIVAPAMQELRDASLHKRREKATKRLEAFKEYLEVSAYEGKFPGRSAPDPHGNKWEPANIWAPDGSTQLTKITSLGTANVALEFGKRKANYAPLTLPFIQVFGGFYVFDKSLGHHMFMTNAEFNEHVWIPLAKQFVKEGLGLKNRIMPIPGPEMEKLLRVSVASGEHFLRGLPNLEAIPGILPAEEAKFLEYAAGSINQNNLPTTITRIYPFELQERLAGMSEMQWSAARRTLNLLQAKDTAVSPLYAEILREETVTMLKDEYPNFAEVSTNRAILYIFSKLK